MISIQKFERGHGMMSCEEQNYRIELVLSNAELRKAVLASIRKNEDNYDRDDLLELFSMTDLKACIETYIYLDTLARDKAMDYIQEAIDLLNGTEPHYDSTFAEDFAKEKAIRDTYEAAKEDRNEKLKEKAIAAHQAHEAEIEAKGAAYAASIVIMKLP